MILMSADAHGVQYSAFVMPNGGIVDDILVF